MRFFFTIPVDLVFAGFLPLDLIGVRALRPVIRRVAPKVGKLLIRKGMDFSFPYKTLSLNAEQSAAVLRDPDYHQRIVASAGSGKTTTLTARIAWLITHYKFKPESIVLMTFSRNAANQMIQRIESLIGPNGVWGGTFHGLSKNLLQLYEPSKLRSLFFIDELIGMGTEWLSTKKGRQWVSKLRYIVVDEFQDINAAQMKMVERMLHPGAKLLVVGDDSQNIYTWRGSDVKFILELEKKLPGIVDDQLRMNYRSTDSIISVANSVMRYIPTLPWKKSMLGTGIQVGRRPDVHFFWRCSDETRWIIQNILSVRRQNKKITMAILSRTNIDLFRMEEELLAAGIPYKLRDAADVDEAEGVDLVTLHASKGLEWDLVFVVHCNDDSFPSSKKAADIICERRLFYVAVTRARKHLVFTYTRNERELSRFVREVPSRLLTYHGLARYCLSEAEMNEGIPTLESLVSSLDGDDYRSLRERGILNWLDMRYIKEENLFPLGESWSVPAWAKKADVTRDFLRFLKTFIKRLFVEKQSSEIIYRDPVAERLLFTLRIFSEDKEFWETWRDELLTILYVSFGSSEAAADPPSIEYATLRDWSEKHELGWGPKDVLAATSLIAKIRGQLRPLRFEKYDLNEFTVRPTRFTVPTEMRGEILKSWRRVSNRTIQARDALEDIWKIASLEMVGEGRNAPLYRVKEMREHLETEEVCEFLEILESYFEPWIQENEDTQVGLEIQSDWTQPETVDLFARGVFWRIAGEDKERISSLRLLLLAITAAFAQEQGILVHSIGILYPLDGRCVSVRLPVDWSKSVIQILQLARR